MRQLKFAEKKLLKKVDFISWEVDNNLHEVKVLRRYGIQKREDYTKYNKLSRETRELARKIKEIDPKDPKRAIFSAALLDKLYSLGLIPTKWNLDQCDEVIMVKLQMAQNLKSATQFVEEGHVRVGTEMVNDPAFIVSRHMEDFVTWTNTSKIRRHVMEYNEMRDDFELS